MSVMNLSTVCTCGSIPSIIYVWNRVPFVVPTFLVTTSDRVPFKNVFR